MSMVGNTQRIRSWHDSHCSYFCLAFKIFKNSNKKNTDAQNIRTGRQLQVVYLGQFSHCWKESLEAHSHELVKSTFP